MKENKMASDKLPMRHKALEKAKGGKKFSRGDDRHLDRKLMSSRQGEKNERY